MEIEELKYKANLRSLHILLVLSFINTGFYLLGELLSGLCLPWMQEYYASNPSMLPEEYSQLVQRSLQIPQWYYLLSALLDAASVVGLVLMWRLRKNGFHCYTLAKLLLMILPLLFLDRSYIGIGNIMLGVLVIAYYFFLMRALGLLSGERVTILPTKEEPSENNESNDEDTPSQDTDE